MKESHLFDWLRDEFCNLSYVNSAYIFGSVLKGVESPRDIDILIVFASIEDVKNSIVISRKFTSRFSISLHIQNFYIEQRPLIADFLAKAQIWECIYEQTSPSEHSRFFPGENGFT